MFRLFFLLLLLFCAVPAYSFETLRVSVPEHVAAGESALELRYSVSCPAVGLEASQPVSGTVQLPGRIVRFELFPGTDTTELGLGKGIGREVTASLSTGSSPCSVKSLEGKVLPIGRASRGLASSTTVVDFRELALRHSPFVVPRDDQLTRSDTDLPLVLAYHIEKGPAGFSLVYTIFFTDEDSHPRVAQAEAMMARYGRRTDVEWIYRVDFNPAGNVLRRRYQGGFSVFRTQEDLGHSEQEFAGGFLPGSEHPILYTCARNNIFCDTPSKLQKERGLVGHHLVPRIEITAPAAREAVMMSAPWMFKTSDAELARERKLARASDEYLYVLIEGQMSQGALVARLELDGKVYWSGHGQGDVDRLGEDMWRRQAYTAIPVGRKNLEALATGQLSGTLLFQRTSIFKGPDLRIGALKFFRLVEAGASYAVQELGPRCRISGVDTACEFGSQRKG